MGALFRACVRAAGPRVPGRDGPHCAPHLRWMSVSAPCGCVGPAPGPPWCGRVAPCPLCEGGDCLPAFCHCPPLPPPSEIPFCHQRPVSRRRQSPVCMAARGQLPRHLWHKWCVCPHRCERVAGPLAVTWGSRRVERGGGGGNLPRPRALPQAVTPHIPAACQSACIYA